MCVTGSRCSGHRLALHENVLSPIVSPGALTIQSTPQTFPSGFTGPLLHCEVESPKLTVRVVWFVVQCFVFSYLIALASTHSVSTCKGKGGDTGCPSIALTLMGMLLIFPHLKLIFIILYIISEIAICFYFKKFKKLRMATV